MAAPGMGGGPGRAIGVRVRPCRPRGSRSLHPPTSVSASARWGRWLRLSGWGWSPGGRREGRGPQGIRGWSLAGPRAVFGRRCGPGSCGYPGGGTSRSCDLREACSPGNNPRSLTTRAARPPGTPNASFFSSFLQGEGGRARPSGRVGSPTAGGTGTDCRNRASLSWYTAGETEAQRGGAACPRAHSRPGAELASPQGDGAGGGRARACCRATLDGTFPCSFPWFLLKVMTGWSRSLPSFKTFCFWVRKLERKVADNKVELFGC